MAAITEKVFPGARNVIRLIAKEGGLAIDTTAITRVTLAFGGITVDSANEGGMGGDVVRSEAGGVIQFRLGIVGSVTLPEAGIYGARLRLYDASNVNGGLVWTHEDQLSDPFKIQVMAS